MAGSVSWYGHLLRREDGLVLRRVLVFVVTVKENREAEDSMEEAG